MNADAVVEEANVKENGKNEEYVKEVDIEDSTKAETNDASKVPDTKIVSDPQEEIEPPIVVFARTVIDNSNISQVMYI